MAADVHLPALEYGCRSATGGAKVASSLFARVEQATGEERPAAALISFANKLGRPQPPRRRRSTAAKSRFVRRSESDRDDMPLGATCDTAWEAKPSDAARSGKSSPDSCILASKPGGMPIWTPQPGSRIYARMAQAFKDARARVERVPSVRAYEAVARECETPKTPGELQEDNGLASPLVLGNSIGSAHEMPIEFSRRSYLEEVIGEPEQAVRPSAFFDREAERTIPWSEEELRAVFLKFSDAEEREVRTEEISSVVRYLGCRPKPDEIQELIREQTLYASLDWDEFNEFIRRFREHELAQLRKQFAEIDIDGDGELDCKEITHMLMHSGFAPTPEGLQEAMTMVDTDDSGKVSFGEFEALRDYLRATRGFLKAEAEEMKVLFQRVSRGQETISSDEIWRISTYLGYQLSQEEISKIVQGVDKNGSSRLNFDEMLQTIRDIRECERDKVRKVVEQFALDTIKTSAFRIFRNPRGHSSIVVRKTKEAKKESAAALPTTLDINDIGAALSRIGYFASPEIISQILKNQLREHENPENLTAEELIFFLDVYRQSEGFTCDELEHLSHIFKQEQCSSVAGDNDEALDALELGRVLRGFGISRTLQQVQRLIEDIDFDGSGEVEFNEFTKMMRQLFHQEAMQRREIFKRLDTVGVGAIQVNQVEVALKMIMDVVPDKTMIQAAMVRSGGSNLKMLEISDFEKFFSQYRRCLVDSVQEHAGFVPSEVEILQEIFNLHDGNKSGKLEAIELRTLINRHMPEAAQSTEGNQEISDILEEVTKSNDNRLDFSSFLWFVRKCHDLRDERDIGQEAEVVRECCYNSEEVEGLRQLFSSNIDWAGELQLEKMAEILQGLVDLTEQDYEELEMYLRELNPVKRAVLRFPQFLKFMRRLTDENLFGVNEAADRRLLRQMAQKKRDRIRSIAGIARTRRGAVQPKSLQAVMTEEMESGGTLAHMISEDGGSERKTAFPRKMGRGMTRGMSFTEAM